MNFEHNAPSAVLNALEMHETTPNVSTAFQVAAPVLGISPAPTPVKSDIVELSAASVSAPGEGRHPSPGLPVPPFTTYESAQDIAYTPEAALKEGLSMLKAIKSNVMKLELGTQIRKDIWLREITGLENRGGPTTLIAICGATGAGKSSLLNAILDDNIVPTSGVRACTAVVTEIGYHDEQTIEADVSFLTLDEWREELQVLLGDLMNDNGTVKRPSDLSCEAGIAWCKVHAVYPLITPDQLSKMTPKQVIEWDPLIAGRLGTSEHICATDSQSFTAQISEFTDSKSGKGGQKKKKSSKDDKKQGIKMQEDKSADLGASAALWPLVRQVVVKCKSSALSTGAILVDLPGVADANAARNSICSDYMKKCHAIWVLAPITRAVDDRTAKDLLGEAFKIQLKMDGNYNEHAITFIATKTDDISCEEIICNLNLENDEEIVAVNEKISQIKSDSEMWKARMTAADKVVKATEMELKEACAIEKEYRGHLKALKTGIPFQPLLTARKARPSSVELSLSRKRKWVGVGEGGPPKHRKNTPEHNRSHNIKDDKVNGVEIYEMEALDHNNHNDSSLSLTTLSETDAEMSGDEESDGEVGWNEQMDNDDDKVTNSNLQGKINETRKKIKALREKLSKVHAENKRAQDGIINTSEELVNAQIEKNGICASKRSDDICDSLIQDFRTGLQEMDEAAAQEHDPNGFDPTQGLHSYDHILLQTFCVSSRDYMRIKNQVKGDGKPTCFTEIDGTRIPALQDYCQSLTLSSRQCAARTFFAHLLAFSSSVQSYLRGVAEVQEEDYKALRDKWESASENGTNGNVSLENIDQLLGPLYWLREEVQSANEDGTFTKKTVQGYKYNVDKKGELIGISFHLSKEFRQVVNTAVKELKKVFVDRLKEKLEKGAANAAAAAVSTSDEFAASMHWNTYRATLSRNGSFHRCLNTELITPFTKNVASSWAAVFEAQLFEPLKAQTISLITKLIQDVEKSAAPGLQDHASYQGSVALNEAKVAMSSIVTLIQSCLKKQQKNISRCLVPNLREQLCSGYREATAQRGPGSVARRKANFHNFIEERRNAVFKGGADALLEGLHCAAVSVGNVLNNALDELAQKIEVSLSVLWEIPDINPGQLCARREVVKFLQNVDRQVALWTEAASEKKNAGAELQE